MPDALRADEMLKSSEDIVHSGPIKWAAAAHSTGLYGKVLLWLIHPRLALHIQTTSQVVLRDIWAC